MYSIKKIAAKSAQLISEGKSSEAIDLLAAFIKLNKKQSETDLIISQVIWEYYQLTGILNVDLISAYPLSDRQVKDIQTFLSKKLNEENLNLSLSNDASIIGGFKAKTPVVEVDCSVQSKLKRLRNIK